MAATIRVDIVSAEKEVFSGEAAAVYAPAETGDVGILPRHAEMLCKLRPGPVRIQTAEGEEQVIYVSGGLLEVQPSIVTILSDTAERAGELIVLEGFAERTFILGGLLGGRAFAVCCCATQVPAQYANQVRPDLAHETTCEMRANLLVRRGRYPKDEAVLYRVESDLQLVNAQTGS